MLHVLPSLMDVKVVKLWMEKLAVVFVIPRIGMRFLEEFAVWRVKILSQMAWEDASLVVQSSLDVFIVMFLLEIQSVLIVINKMGINFLEGFVVTPILMHILMV